jgi:UDP-N-acetylglucosamine:LPS N-acetylglucosamine transferase
MIELTGHRLELALVLEEDSVGWAVSPDEPEQLVEAILKLSAERKELDGMARHARTLALEKSSVERTLREYRKVLSS